MPYLAKNTTIHMSSGNLTGIRRSTPKRFMDLAHCIQLSVSKRYRLPKIDPLFFLEIRPRKLVQ
jgi:hypothetical protein